MQCVQERERVHGRMFVYKLVFKWECVFVSSATRVKTIARGTLRAWKSECVCVWLYEICSIAGYIDDSMVSGCDCTASPVTSALCYWWYPSARWMRIPPPASTQGPLKDKRGPVCCLTDLPTVFCLSLSHLARTASHSPWSLRFLAHTNVSEMDTMVQRHKQWKVKSQLLYFYSY